MSEVMDLLGDDEGFKDVIPKKDDGDDEFWSYGIHIFNQFSSSSHL